MKLLLPKCFLFLAGRRIKFKHPLRRTLVLKNSYELLAALIAGCCVFLVELAACSL